MDSRFELDKIAQMMLSLKIRLCECGYSNNIFKKAYKKAKGRSHNDLLFSHKKAKDNDATRIITKYCRQHKQVRHIFNKYWHLLSMDSTLAPFVSDHPLITYKRAPFLQDRLVHSEFKQDREDRCKITGTFPCGNCQFMDTSKNITLPNGDKFEPKHYINCHTPGVVSTII